MMNYLERRKRVLEHVREGRIGEAKKMLTEEITSIKYLKKELRGQFKMDTGYRKLVRPMDEGATAKMARYNAEQEFYQNLKRAIRGFEKKIAERMS